MKDVPNAKRNDVPRSHLHRCHSCNLVIVQCVQSSRFGRNFFGVLEQIFVVLRGGLTVVEAETTAGWRRHTAELPRPRCRSGAQPSTKRWRGSETSANAMSFSFFGRARNISVISDSAVFQASFDWHRPLKITLDSSSVFLIQFKVGHCNSLFLNIAWNSPTYIVNILYL